MNKGGRKVGTFTGLLRKDWMLSQTWFLRNLLVVFGIWLVSIAIGQYFNELEIPFYALGFIVSLHVFYPLWHILTSLSYEAKTQVWLHNPNSMVLLIGSKLIMAVVSALLSILLSTLLYGISILLFKNLLEMGFSDFVNVTTGVWLASIYIGVWAIFYWSIYCTLIMKMKNKVIVSIIVAVLAYATMIPHTLFSSSALYTTLLEFGPIPINLYQSIFTNNEDEILYEFALNNASIGLLVFYGGIALLLFLVSARLVNKKVEL